MAVVEEAVIGHLATGGCCGSAGGKTKKGWPICEGTLDVKEQGSKTVGVTVMAVRVEKEKDRGAAMAEGVQGL